MEETQQQQGLRRSLKARHMNMIAIGGAIGTGLFSPAVKRSALPVRAVPSSPMPSSVSWFISS